MNLMEQNQELADKVAAIYKATAYANIWVSTSSFVEFKHSVMDSGSGILNIGNSITLCVQSIDDVNRLRQAVNELALAMMKFEAEDVQP